MAAVWSMRGFCGAFSRLGPSALAFPFRHLSPDSSQGTPFRSDTLLRTFLCFSDTLPARQHQNQSVYSGFRVRQELLPPLHLSSLASFTLAVAQMYQADPCLKAPVLAVLSAWSPFPLVTTWGARHTFRCGFHRVSFSVRLSSQVTLLKTTMSVSSASLTV